MEPNLYNSLFNRFRLDQTKEETVVNLPLIGLMIKKKSPTNNKMRIFNKNNTLIKLITTNKKIEHCLYLVIKIIKVLLMMIIHN